LHEAIALFEQRVYKYGLEAYRWDMVRHLLEVPLTKKGKSPKKPVVPRILTQGYGD